MKFRSLISMFTILCNFFRFFSLFSLSFDFSHTKHRSQTSKFPTSIFEGNVGLLQECTLTSCVQEGVDLPRGGRGRSSRAPDCEPEDLSLVVCGYFRVHQSFRERGFVSQDERGIPCSGALRCRNWRRSCIVHMPDVPSHQV